MGITIGMNRRIQHVGWPHYYKLISASSREKNSSLPTKPCVLKNNARLCLGLSHVPADWQLYPFFGASRQLRAPLDRFEWLGREQFSCKVGTYNRYKWSYGALINMVITPGKPIYFRPFIGVIITLFLTGSGAHLVDEAFKVCKKYLEWESPLSQDPGS